jgi:hypothetical protein
MKKSALVSGVEITHDSVHPGLNRYITTTFDGLPTKKVMYAADITDNELLEKVLSLLEQPLEYKRLGYSNRPYTEIQDSTEITNSITPGACPGFTSNYVKEYVEEDDTLSLYVLTNDIHPIFIVGTTITNECNCIHISTLCSNKEKGVVDRFKPLVPGKKMMRTLQLVTMILELPCIVLESLPGAEDFYLNTGFFYLASTVNSDGSTTVTLTNNKDNTDIIINKRDKIPIMFWINPDYELDTFNTDCKKSNVTSEFINFYLNNIEDEAFFKARDYTRKNLESELGLLNDEDEYDEQHEDDEQHEEPEIEFSINSQDSLGSLMGSPDHSSNYDNTGLGSLMGSPDHSSNYDMGYPKQEYQEYPDFYPGFNMSQPHNVPILSRQPSVIEENPDIGRKGDYKSGINTTGIKKERTSESLQNIKTRRDKTLFNIRVIGLGGGKSKRRAKGGKKSTRKVKRKTRRVKRKSKKSKRRY